MLLGAAIALAVESRRLPQNSARSFPRAVLVAFGAWALIAILSLAWSEQPAYSRTELRSELLYGAVALVAFFFSASDAQRWRMRSMALFGGTVAVLLAQVLQDAAPFAISRHAMDGGGGPFSTHLVLIAPLLCALVWPRPWGFARGATALAGAVGILLATAWFTGNRMVWVTLIAQLAVAMLLWQRAPVSEAPRKRGLRLLGAIAALAMVVAFAGAIVERSEREFRASASMTSSIERDLRPRLWRVAWRVFCEAPWLGHGFGREIRAADFLPETPVGTNHPPVRHAHNVFFDVAIELGLVGVAAFAALLAALAYVYWRFLDDPSTAPWGIIALMLLTGFVVKNLTDDFFYRHNALVFWALNGMLLGLGRARAQRAAPPGQRLEERSA